MPCADVIVSRFHSIWSAHTTVLREVSTISSSSQELAWLELLPGIFGGPLRRDSLLKLGLLARLRFFRCLCRMGRG